MIGDETLDHLIKMASANFLHSKVIIILLSHNTFLEASYYAQPTLEGTGENLHILFEILL